MKKIFWRPQGIPLFGFILIALFSVAGFLAVHHLQGTKPRPYYQEELEASRLALMAMNAIKAERLARRIPLNPEVDPAQSGLVGKILSPVTSDAGDLEAKQTTINPNFAALVVEFFKQVGVRENDRVAVSLTGSFPALNIAVFAAIKVLNLKPIIIASVASSQWGANDPNLLWIDMERIFNEKGIFPFRSVAASIGGRYDRGKGMSEEGRQLILQAITRNGLEPIVNATLRENVDQRMTIYLSGGQPKFFINVGGSVAAVGGRRWRNGYYKTILLPSEAPGMTKGNFVMYRFLKAGVPVIHLENAKELAERYGLPVAPEKIPLVGEGGIYTETRYKLWLAGAVLGGIIAGLFIFSRTEFGFRLLQVTSHRDGTGPPEPMA